MTKATDIYGNRLEVFLLERFVGSISVDQNDKSFFAFDPEYVNDSNRPVLSLFFRKNDGSLIDTVKPYRQKVHPFFSNLLPEGNLREYLAAKLKINKEREFYLLAALGSDLPGAVIIKSGGKKLEPIEHKQPDEQQNSPNYIPKFSLAGVQLKFSALMEAGGRLTIRTTGADGDHIIKLPSNKHDLLPEAEFASMKLAKLMGIDTAEVSLVNTADIADLPADIDAMNGQGLVAKRFDRSPSGRIHVEDFAQVFGKFPNEKYKGVAYHDLAHVIWIMSGEEGIKEFVRRLVFTIAIGNADMHLKNWSLLYRDGKNPQLSPAYDFVPTIAFHPDPHLGLSLGGEKLMTAINLDNFEKFAAKAEVSAKFVNLTVKEAVEQFQAVWTEHKRSLPFPPTVREVIDSHIGKADLFKPSKLNLSRSAEAEHSFRYFYLAGQAGYAGKSTANSLSGDLYNRADHLAKAKDFKGAVRLASASIAEKPSAEAYYNRGLYKLELNEPEEGIADFMTALTLKPLAEAAYNAASAHWDISQTPDVVEKTKRQVLFEKALQEAIKLNPNLAEAWYNLGVYDIIRQSARADESFKAALAINPYFSEAVFNLAISMFISGNVSESKDKFETAAKLDPDAQWITPELDKTYDRITLMSLRGVSGPPGPMGPTN
ncbi:MAG: HipA domain-containing protein [Cyanobacteria bacterium REEB67]|nr:HipA domain-containing protein [Cyanobacteria bacterium REEB67]